MGLDGMSGSYWHPFHGIMQAADGGQLLLAVSKVTSCIPTSLFDVGPKC